jgi:hypothetical protein
LHFLGRILPKDWVLKLKGLELMSIDYRGRQNTGYLTKVTNTIDRKKYNVSTVIRAETSGWETAVLKQGFLGIFRPVVTVSAQDEEEASKIHDWVEEIIERYDPMLWEHAILQFTGRETGNTRRENEAPTTKIETAIDSEPSEAAVARVLEEMSRLHRTVVKNDWPQSPLNTTAVLEAKAKGVASWILDHCDTLPLLATSLRTAPTGENEARQAIAEIGAFLISFIDRFTTDLLGSQNRDVFLASLVNFVMKGLQDRKLDTETFGKLLQSRYEEYEQYPLGHGRGELCFGNLEKYLGVRYVLSEILFSKPHWRSMCFHPSIG